MSPADQPGAVTSTPEFRLMGTRSVLIELPDTATVMAWHAHLSAHPLDAQIEVIAAARTLLFKAATRRGLDTALTALRALTPDDAAAGAHKRIDIDVVYNGEDLEAVAEHYSISTEALIDRHTSEDWLAAFGGFSPGFAYCTAAGSGWDTPRRASPRTKVPRGSVALAGPFSAVYPIDSPGGWQLLGSSPTPVWDLGEDPPNRISPGDEIRYRAVSEEITLSPATASAPASQPARPAATVTAVGLQALFQDRGRTGHGDTGVPTSGVLDRASARQANRIVGNRGDATVIECLFGGFGLRAETDLTLAVTGAEAPVTVGGQPAPLRTPLVVPAGESVEIGAPTHGIRSYLAVRGGFVTSEVLGSTATDTLSRLGPEPISAGQQLKVPVTPDVGAVGGPEPATLPDSHLMSATLRVVPGPREDWCAPGEMETLTCQVWTVSQESNRIAMRLHAGADGRPLRRAEDTGELASEGMVSGAIQVPPEGQPVLFLADHPVTGGYPVIATVIAEDLDLAAQLSPGAQVRFTVFETAADSAGDPT